MTVNLCTFASKTNRYGTIERVYARSMLRTILDSFIYQVLTFKIQLKPACQLEDVHQFVSRSVADKRKSCHGSQHANQSIRPSLVQASYTCQCSARAAGSRYAYPINKSIIVINVHQD